MLIRHLPQNVLEDSAVLIISSLDGRVDSQGSREADVFASAIASADVEGFARLELIGETLNVE